jgi:uncharacterized protein YeeX (DUF496 family)
VFDTIKKTRENQRELVLMGMLGRYSRLEELGYRAYSSFSSYEGSEECTTCGKSKGKSPRDKRWSAVFDTIKKTRENQTELVLMGMLGRYSRLEELGYRAYSSLSSYKGSEGGTTCGESKGKSPRDKRWSAVFDTIKKTRENQRKLVLMGILGRYSRLEELGYRAYSSLSSRV